jgi:hypothetical protein
MKNEEVQKLFEAFQQVEGAECYKTKDIYFVSFKMKNGEVLSIKMSESPYEDQMWFDIYEKREKDGDLG